MGDSITQFRPLHFMTACGTDQPFFDDHRPVYIDFASPSAILLQVDTGYHFITSDPRAVYAGDSIRL
jgi:hypothetical protein